jgi:CRISPR-associated protein Cas1
MGAITLLVDRRGAELSISQNTKSVCLCYPNGEKHRVGLYALCRIVISEDTSISSAVLYACETAQVSIILIPGRRKGNSVNLFPYTDGNSQLRIAQYRAYFDDSIRLSIARKVVEAKIRAQSLCLRRQHLDGDFEQAEEHIQKANDHATLMGIEGGVAKEYFAQWRTLWDKGWHFNERNRRPPRDPVNALLSLSYTMAGNSVGQMLGIYGLDLNLGFLHAPQSNRPSLVLDVLEPLRAWIDQWILQKVQEGLLTPKHFYQDKEAGCRLNKEGRNVFFPAWYNDAEEWLRAPMRDSVALMLGNLRRYRERLSEMSFN